MCRDSRDDRLNSCIIMLHFIFIFMFIEQYKHSNTSYKLGAYLIFC